MFTALHSELIMCNKKPINWHGFVSSHLLWTTSYLYSRRKPSIRNESKDYGVVDESSVEQHICGSTSITSIVREKCTYPPSASGCYGRQADMHVGRWNTGEFL